MAISETKLVLINGLSLILTNKEVITVKNDRLDLQAPER